MTVPAGSRRATTVLVSVVTFVFFMTSAYADHVEPDFVGGNPTCIDLIDDPDAVEFRINNPVDGNGAIIDPATAATYVDPVTGFEITIDIYQSADGPEFNFYDASIPLDAVFVKGGPNGNLYLYDPAVDADTGLHSPLNPSNGKWFGLSHISFCWVPRPSTELTLDAIDPGTTVLTGSDVTLTFAETNDGNFVLSDPTVTADNGCVPVLTDDGDGDADLDPGETWLFECTVEDVTSATTITAIGSGVTPGGDTVTWCEDEANPPADTICDQDEIEEVDIDVINPSTDLTLDSSDPGLQVLAGTDVTLVFAETNDGDTPLENATVTADNGCVPVLTDDGDGDADLDPGETWLFECTVEDVTTDTTITAIGWGEDELGNIITWCADPTDPDPGVVCDQDEIEEVDIDVINPSTVLTLSSANPGTTINEGESVTLTFSEDNDGDVALDDPTVTADNGCTPAYVSGDTHNIGFLDTDETWLFACTISPTSDVTITAIGSGVDPLGNTVTWCQDPTDPPAGVLCDQDEITVVDITVIPAGEGCTPGYWKTHPAAWGPTGFAPSDTLESVFNVPDSFGLDNNTLLQALDFAGGSGSTGAARILLRAAVAALLNSAHPDVDYPRTTAEVISDVNAALTGSRSTMLALASELDADNNLGCPLS
jgi:hypothetical protein